MHLLAAKPGVIADGTEAVDLGQTPADIVVLSAADSELACLAAAYREIGPGETGQDGGWPSLRLASLLYLGHNMSVDLYAEQVLARARLIVIRLLGGRAYWPYGVEQVVGLAAEFGIPVAFLPGDDQPDPELAGLSSVPPGAAHRLWQYLVHGGIDNAGQFLRFAASLIGAKDESRDNSWREPAPLARAGLYWPGLVRPDISAIRAKWLDSQPVAAFLFYRALVQAANTAPIDAMIAALGKRGVNALPIFVTSLKDPAAAEIVAAALGGVEPNGAGGNEMRPGIVLNATGFALSAPGKPAATPFDDLDCPVLQLVFSGGAEDAWRAGSNGLSARDIAMSVALPEMDGRILSRAISFKDRARRDAATETDIVAYRPVADRVAFTADLTRAWLDLRRTPSAKRRVALVLANYPNRDGRIGNAVGLDTPASAVNILRALAGAGYRISDMPDDGAALIARLAAGPTNAATDGREIVETLAAAEYHDFFETLPARLREQVNSRWGAPEDDPFFIARPDTPAKTGAFAIPAFRCGHAVIGLQPARGYNIDPAASYHDPDLVPPHGYFAFYAWLRKVFAAQAIIHVGKHGNLEWLPGKALALSAECYPEAALGPMPHLYPFIVNDPGEGSQAKRRAGAVIVDHLTPPLTRADSYGPLAELERLIDEYYEATHLDPRRLAPLARSIVELSQTTGLDADCGIAVGDATEEALTKLDGYLCEIKEMQIRDGLHILGESPTGEARDDLLAALLRIPRGAGDAAQSLPRALAADLGLAPEFDPLDCDMAAPWRGARPDALAGLGGESLGPWRSTGDTVARIEALAKAIIAGAQTLDPAWSRTAAVCAALADVIIPALDASGAAETRALLAGLDGRFVAPGPSGAPTRGRPDVLPTGRNFYSVDPRAVPTPAAWQLGWKSAALLIERHRQDHGAWPRAIALSAWGTSNMRTGGDDISQALALIGARPCWDRASGRVTGFEIVPVSVLDRPRVDVTLRISGFFRDAFPGLIDLFDSAVRAIADLDESESDNPLAARIRTETRAMTAAGEASETARRRAGYRVFGSKPGAYGAGLQALIDERGWQDDSDLARAYVAWGGHAYGAGAVSETLPALFEARLKGVEAVVHNQDNREHDLLDSDDYYQFEGGLAVAVRNLSGKRPALYHNDHSRPESPRIQSLEEEIARVVRARVVNPKWIAGVMRHGYKGAFEMAATVDYLFAFAATADVVRDHHFDATFDAYLGDPKVRDFLAEANPAALREMSERLIEALDRGLWRPRANTTFATLHGLAGREGETTP